MFSLFRKKPDGVITSVRYTDDGQRLALIRFYGRRGAIYGDLEIIGREALLERLEAGQRFVIGQRQGNVPGSFATGKWVELVGQDRGEAIICTEGSQDAQDWLEGALRF